MCYELRFFQRWGKWRAKERVETHTGSIDAERSRAEVETPRPAPERKVEQPKERERVYEDIF
jgi:hypothetical protein